MRIYDKSHNGRRSCLRLSQIKSHVHGSTNKPLAV
uniref:Uncharacterized protein n=1 Tax=Rhizophora mucronata TaxID=61149 RepID=A0A2P2QSR3_RHIMU